MIFVTFPELLWHLLLSISFYQGLAKYVVRSAHFLQDNIKQLQRIFELTAKESRLRMWFNYLPPVITDFLTDFLHFLLLNFMLQLQGKGCTLLLLKN